MLRHGVILISGYSVEEVLALCDRRDTSDNIPSSIRPLSSPKKSAVLLLVGYLRVMFIVQFLRGCFKTR